MKKYVLLAVFFILTLTDCNAYESVKGATIEIDHLYSGFWVAEFYLNKRLTSWETSWGKIQGSQNGILIDFADQEMQILSVDGGIVVHEVKLINEYTLEMKVRVVWADEEDETYDYLLIHLLDDPDYMWIETKGASEGGGRIFGSEGPARILKKVAGPDMPIPALREDEYIYDPPE